MTILYRLAPCAEDVQDVNGRCLQGPVPVSAAGTHGGMRLNETAPTSTRKSPLICISMALRAERMNHDDAPHISAKSL